MGRKSKADQRQAEILEHLIYMVSKEGLEGASLAKIAKRMGVNKSLVAHYFPSKEEMMVALVENITERYRKTYHKMFEGVEAPEKRFEIFLDTIINLDWEIGDEITDIVYYSCFYLSFRNDKISRRIRALYEFIKEVYLKELTLYKENGIINVEDPEQTAVFILALAEGLYYYTTAMGKTNKDQQRVTQMRAKVLKMLKCDIAVA